MSMEALLKAQADKFEGLSLDLLRDKLLTNAEAAGADPTKLTESQLVMLNRLLKSSISAVGGDKRKEAHLSAQFKLGKFSTEAQAFVEAAAWWEGFRKTLLDLAAIASSAALEVVARGLAEAMSGGFRG